MVLAVPTSLLSSWVQFPVSKRIVSPTITIEESITFCTTEKRNASRTWIKWYSPELRHLVQFIDGHCPLIVHAMDPHIFLKRFHRLPPLPKQGPLIVVKNRHSADELVNNGETKSTLAFAYLIGHQQIPHVLINISHTRYSGKFLPFLISTGVSHLNSATPLRIGTGSWWWILCQM